MRLTRAATERTAAMLVLVLFTASACRAAVAPMEWNFAVSLDGKTIGAHRFVLSSAGDGTQAVSSEARFDVKWLGVPLYRYQHQDSERWAGGCLRSIDARTDEDGRLTEVHGQALDGRFGLKVHSADHLTEAPVPAAGCLLSFAYWNPAALAEQNRLLDPGSGRVEPVVIAPSGAAPNDLKATAQSGPVRGLRIMGLAQPINVWYAGERWIGLDTLVSGGRRLSYRLR